MVWMLKIRAGTIARKPLCPVWSALKGDLKRVAVEMLLKMMKKPRDNPMVIKIKDED